MVLLLCPLIECEGRGGEPSATCTVLISMKIRPYLEALEGIKKVFGRDKTVDLESYYLTDVESSWKKSAYIKQDYDHHAVIALGPEALAFLTENSPDPGVHKVYSMIVDPVVPSSRETSFCGYFLSVDANEQLYWINRVLPAVSRLGILYDPRYNSDYVDRALQVSMEQEITVEPLTVGSKRDVPETLRVNWKKIDALLLIPDATVISSSLVKYIIKDALSNKVPVIGYNRFFLKNGALMAFTYDYEAIGMDTANYVKQLMMEQIHCREAESRFSITVNKPIADQLGIDLSMAAGSGVTILK